MASYGFKQDFAKQSAINSNPNQPSIQINVLWDGLFLAFALIVTILGISLLWNASSLKKKTEDFCPDKRLLDL